MQAPTSRSSVPSYFLAAAAAALALTPFLSWLNAIFIGSVSLLDVFRLDGDSPEIIYATVGAFVLLAVLAVVRVPGASVFGLLAGAGALFYAGYVIVNAASVIGDSEGAVRLGVGPYAAAAAAVGVITCSVAAMTRGRP